MCCWYDVQYLQTVCQGKPRLENFIFAGTENLTGYQGGSLKYVHA